MSVHRHRLTRIVRPRPDSAPTAPRSHQPPARRGGVAPMLARRLASERGDVPGWVLITLMTAGIVVALWAVASEQIVQIFTNAMAPFLGGSL